MAGYEKVVFAICEKCKNTFNSSAFLFNSVNVDIKQGIYNDFINDKLNIVKCNHCQSIFIYERPFVAYSISKQYAIYSNQSLTDKSLKHGRKSIYKMFGFSNMKFRLVDFQCEASEKVRIFENNLCDIKIEKLKHILFDESYFKNKQDNMVLFKEIKDNLIIFEYKDYLQNVIETKSVLLDEYNNISVEEIDINNSSYVEWKRI